MNNIHFIWRRSSGLVQNIRWYWSAL